MSTILTVKMPDIGEGVVEGEVIEWLKKVNETVSQDEPVVVLMTDKATVELPAPKPGKIVKHYYGAGQTALKDKPLYDIEIDANELGEYPLVSQEEKILPQFESEKPKVYRREAFGQRTVVHEGEILAIPRVRKRAYELGIDLTAVKGTGSKGRITEDDLKHFISERQAHPSSSLALPDDEEIPLIGIRHFMVKKMTQAKDNIPHFSYLEQADAVRLIQIRQKIKESAAKENIHLTYMPFFIKALSLTIKKFPMINSSLSSAGNKLILHKQHHIGIAMASNQGLIVPVLKGVQEMNIEGVIKAFESLKQKALKGMLQPQDMKEGTITISNFGVLGGGGLWATPIINYPEVAILALAKIQKQPIVKQDSVVVRDVLNLSWSFDHRIIDGDMAAAVSHYYSTLIQNPASLL